MQLAAIYYLCYIIKSSPPLKKKGTKRLHTQVHHHYNSLDFCVKYGSNCKITIKNLGQLLCLYTLSVSKTDGLITFCPNI